MPGCSLGSETPPGGVGAQGGRSHTCRDNTIYIACLLLLVEKVGSGCFQLFVIAGHHCHMVDLVGGHMLLLGKEVLDQGPHNLLWRPGGADVRDDGAPVGLLSIADPA